ncbi:Alpha/Beta hydrolase protein [Aspergillus alliaceus]|uniref:Alpha/Beta hydrolase protein n=1 Tax=Petromyces alliaceus TaxID=209559 RepID=A0A5N7CQV4_PETAA|nr:Alpha/Beta hydrolase protein [Aspergillus alliaceus]
MAWSTPSPQEISPHFVSISLLAAALPTWTQHVAKIQPVGAYVWTSSGLIEGIPAPERSNVSEYLRIPFAASPTGDLRFAPPVAYHSNSAVHATQKVVQTFAQQLGKPQSEDCLYLNMWAKPTTSSLKPVLAFIHGDRTSYRLNIFGFSGAPGFPQNVASLDQRLAVEWVHSNIAAFGGDPCRIAMFGQSAGGAAVDYYSYIWGNKPLVSGLISHSGTALSFKPNTPQESASYFHHVSHTIGCRSTTTNTTSIIQRLRQQPNKSTLKKVAKVPPAQFPVLPQPIFHPTVNNITIFNNCAEHSAAGNFSSIPYLLTTNANKAGYYRVTAFVCPTGKTASDRAAAGIPAWQSRYFGDWDNLRLYSSSGLPSSAKEMELARYMVSAEFRWPGYDKDGEFGVPPFFLCVFVTETLVGPVYGDEAKARFLLPSLFEQESAGLGSE